MNKYSNFRKVRFAIGLLFIFACLFCLIRKDYVYVPFLLVAEVPILLLFSRRE